MLACAVFIFLCLLYSSSKTITLSNSIRMKIRGGGGVEGLHFVPVYQVTNDEYKKRPKTLSIMH